MPAEENSLKQLISFFYQWEEQTPDALFLRQPYGEDWKELTYAQAGQEARRMATALQSMGLKTGSHIGIYSKNCYHWILADLAIMMAGHVSVPFFPTLGKEELKEVLDKGNVDALFAGKLDEWASVKDGVPHQVQIIAFPHYPGNAQVKEGLQWDELVAKYPPLQGNPERGLDDLWTILFTSGTTGSPKGVMLTHRCPATIMQNEERHDDLQIGRRFGMRHFSYLPLNHVGERVAVEMMAIFRGSSISFAESLDTFVKNLQETKPILFLGVPRIYAKFQAAVFAKLPPARLKMLLRLPIVSGLIKKKIRNNLGLSEAIGIFTAAAPMPDSLKAWFSRLDIQIRDVYGMTENCGPVTVMPPNSKRMDSVGKAMGDAKIKILPETGEIALYAPWNMTGYYQDPKLTAEVLHDGWVHTGDQGDLDEQGFLRIVGRVKDTFKSAKGKFIIPAPLESGFADNELLEQVCVIGLGLPQPMVLCSLSALGQQADPAEVSERMKADLQTINADLPTYQKISAAIIVKEAWTVENQVLTPTLKVRRNKINELYRARYEEWAEQGETVVWE